jgi:hypothetical protein
MRINNKNSAKDTAEENLNDVQFFFQFYLSPHLTIAGELRGGRKSGKICGE